MFNYQAPAQLLADRVILVTGAGDGIGRCAAECYAAHGATVILLGRTTKKLEATYDAIEAAGHPQPAIYPLNLEGAVRKDYDDLAQSLHSEFGRLDGLLHNAGQLGSRTPLEHYDVEMWYKIHQVNLHAPFMLTQACLPLLKQSADASVVFTSSAVGRQGRAYWGAYATSKFAIEGLTQTLADEVEQNTQIRVNSIDPGPARTAMRAKAYPAESPASLPSPEQLMPLYLYLMGADSQGINGQQWDAQHGQPAQPNS